MAKHKKSRTAQMNILFSVFANENTSLSASNANIVVVVVWGYQVFKFVLLFSCVDRDQSKHIDGR